MNAQQTFFAFFYFLQKQKPRQTETQVPVTLRHRTLPHPGKCVAPGSEVGDTTRVECTGISLLALLYAGQTAVFLLASLSPLAPKLSAQQT